MLMSGNNFRRPKRFQRKRSLRALSIFWIILLEIQQYMRQLLGLGSQREGPLSCRRENVHSVYEMPPNMKKYREQCILKRIMSVGRTAWSFLLILVVFTCYLSFLKKVLPNAPESEKQTKKGVTEVLGEFKRHPSIPDWHLPYINNQLLQMRAQGKRVDSEVIKKFYHLPHSIAEMDNFQEAPISNSGDGETSLENTVNEHLKNQAEQYSSEKKGNSMNSKQTVNEKSSVSPKVSTSVSNMKFSKGMLIVPETNIPFFTVSQIVEKSIRKLVKEYLEPFKPGIYQNQYLEVLHRSTYAVSPKGANKGVTCVFIQIIDREIYLYDPYKIVHEGKDLYKGRLEQVLILLHEAVKRKSIRNVELVLSLHDCVQTVSKAHTYRVANYVESRPIFTVIQCNFSDNLPFPIIEGSTSRGDWKSWDSAMEKLRKQSVPWSQKKNQAIFRGGLRASSYFQSRESAQLNCSRVGRGKLLELQRERKDLFNISVGGKCIHSYELHKVPFEKQQQFKYNIYAEGNCFWADRLQKQLFASFTIIKQQTPCGLYFEPLLKPMVHYIPTDYFFNDLIEQIEWAKAYDGQAMTIMKNANEFASEYLTFPAILTFVEILLNEYALLLRQPVHRHKDAFRVLFQ
eukprot:jgi/Galph1/1965/GphlegSOOS_G647.1